MEAATPEFVVSKLHYIDYTIIIVYFVGVFLVGSYFGKYVKTAGDFFTSGKTLPWWAIGMSIVATDISATDFVATAGAGYRYGISAANFDWIGSMPAMAFAAFIFIPYYWRADIYTVPEFLGRRYNGLVQLIHASIWGVFLLVMLAVMLWLTAKTMNTVLGWNVYFSIWLIVGVTGLYTLSGGLTSVVITDVVQLIIMFVGGAAVMVLCLWQAGGWNEMQAMTLAKGPEYQHHYDLLLPHDTATPYPWTGIIVGLGVVLATGYMAGNQAIVQRTFGARSEWDAKASMLFAGFLKVFIPVIVMLPALATVVLIPRVEDVDQAVPTMWRQLLPAGLRGLMFAALFAALMSTVSSYLNSAAAIWTSDLYGKVLSMFTRRPISSRHALRVGRIFTAVFVLAGALIAPLMEKQETMYNFIQASLSMFQGPVLAILLLGILWPRTTQWGALAGLILGVAFTTILSNVDEVFPSDNPFLFVAAWSFPFCLLVTIGVSLVTPPEPEEKLRGLTFGQVLRDGEIQRVLHKRAS
ncbi:MAG: sodium/solute symporter [Candidatus Hydrogenedentota bacterium]